MSAVVVGSYLENIPDVDKTLFSEDKTIVVDSKVFMLGLDNIGEAHLKQYITLFLLSFISKSI